MITECGGTVSQSSAMGKRPSAHPGSRSAEMVARIPLTNWFYLDIGSGGLSGVIGDCLSPNLVGEWHVDCFVEYRGDQVNRDAEDHGCRFV